jgi:diketogulonate reductase-like aldo/keto reductase
MLGLGTYDSRDEQELITAIKSAINAGYRHFDCAYFYENENIIGKAFHESIAESNGTLKREDLYVVSKCWNTFHSRDNVFLCLDRILSNFKFDYIDLYLIHWPFGFKENEGLMPLDENSKAIDSGVHFVETYKVSFIHESLI